MNSPKSDRFRPDFPTSRSRERSVLAGAGAQDVRGWCSRQRLRARKNAGRRGGRRDGTAGRPVVKQVLVTRQWVPSSRIPGCAAEPVPRRTRGAVCAGPPRPPDHGAATTVLNQNYLRRSYAQDRPDVKMISAHERGFLANGARNLRDRLRLRRTNCWMATTAAPRHHSRSSAEAAMSSTVLARGSRCSRTAFSTVSRRPP